MTDDAIITAEGRDHWLDLRYIHRTKECGDITLILTWDWGGEQPTAALVLAPTRWDRRDGDPTLCVIRRQDAWRWSRTHNNDRQMIGYHGFGKPPSSDAWQLANAIYYAGLLNLDANDMRVANRIRGIIEDHLDDLVLLPPPPIREGMAETHIQITDSETGKTRNAVLREA